MSRTSKGSVRFTFSLLARIAKKSGHPKDILGSFIIQPGRHCAMDVPRKGFLNCCFIFRQSQRWYPKNIARTVVRSLRGQTKIVPGD
jgi:hypothetical protein